MRRLEGKRAVVTGGGSGIAARARSASRAEGASVLVVGRAGNTEETAAAIRSEGGIASALITDAAVEENVAEMVRRCVSEFGGLEIFFANIGVTGTTRRCWSRRWKSGRKSIASTPSVASSRSNTPGVI